MRPTSDAMLFRLDFSAIPATEYAKITQTKDVETFADHQLFSWVMEPGSIARAKNGLPTERSYEMRWNIIPLTIQKQL